MKWTLLAVLATVAACGANSETPEQRLIGAWIYWNGSTGVGLEFDSNGIYSGQVLQITSATTGNDEVETGVYTMTDTEITCTPLENSCPGPDPAYRLIYHVDGNNLEVLTPNGLAIAFSRNTASPSSNSIVTFGCFQSDGSFVTGALAPVSN